MHGPMGLKNKTLLHCHSIPFKNNIDCQFTMEKAHIYKTTTFKICLFETNSVL